MEALLSTLHKGEYFIRQEIPTSFHHFVECYSFLRVYVFHYGLHSSHLSKEIQRAHFLTQTSTLMRVGLQRLYLSNSEIHLKSF